MTNGTLTLTANIDDQTRYLFVTGTVGDYIEGGYDFRIGDELLTLQGFVLVGRESRQDRNHWYVRRAQDGSSAASHTAGAAILGATDAFVSADSGTTPPSPWSGEGGGGGGEYQPIPLVYNQTDIVLTGIPVLVTTVDTLVLPTSYLSISTAWDGTTPRGRLFTSDGYGIAFSTAGFDMTLANATGVLADDLSSGSRGSLLGAVYGDGAGTNTPGGLFVPAGTTVLFGIDDGSGNDPGSSHGVGSIGLFTTPADGSGGGAGSTPTLDAVLGVSGEQDIADALTFAASPTVSNVFATMADVPGGPGGLRVLDLGLVNVADLIDGAQTLYTPADGEFVVLLPGNPADFVQIDNAATSVIIGQHPTLAYGVDVDITWDQGDTDPRFLEHVPFAADGGKAPIADGTPIVGIAAIRDTRPFLAAIAVQSGGDPVIIDSLPVWQSAHGYGADALVRGSGHIWIGGEGTSDSSEPDWASNFGGSVIDNDITWYDQGELPVVGSLHVYAMVATPVAP